MQSTELVVFDKTEIPALISQFGIKTRKKGSKKYLVDHEGEVKCCDSCKRPLQVKHVGSIAHGSRKVYCDNPLCISGWVAKNKI